MLSRSSLGFYGLVLCLLLTVLALTALEGRPAIATAVLAAVVGVLSCGLLAAGAHDPKRSCEPCRHYNTAPRK